MPQTDTRSPIHVAHVVEAFSSGIVESVSRITHGLPADRFRVSIVHSTRTETPADFRARFPDHVQFVPWTAAREIDVKSDLGAMRELRRILRALRPQIVHGHSAKGGALVRLLAPVLDAACVYSPRGFPFLRLDVSPGRRRLFRVIERVLARTGALTVAASESELALARGLGGRSRLICNMVDVAGLRASAAPPPRPDGEPVRVGTVGRISPQKNFPLFASIAARCPDMRFVWVGGGEVEAGRAVPPNVEITGWISRDRVLETLAGFDIYLQTSLWEGLPIAVLEAMALEKPIVAYPAVGNVDLVQDGANGRLCRDLESFVAALRELAELPDMARAMGRHSLERVTLDYDARRNVPQWRALYEELAAGRPA